VSHHRLLVEQSAASVDVFPGDGGEQCTIAAADVDDQRGGEVVRSDYGRVAVVGAVLHHQVEELGLGRVRPEVLEARHPEHRLGGAPPGSHGVLELRPRLPLTGRRPEHGGVMKRRRRILPKPR